MRTADFDFDLPEELIAQHPLARRDASRLLVLDSASGQVQHRHFPDLFGFLRAGDVLVLNNSRVMPARLRGTNARTGGEFEILLLTENARNDWWCLLRPGKRARVGTQIVFGAARTGSAPIRGTVVELNDEGHRRLLFEGPEEIKDRLEEFGEVPLPPYIRRESPDQLEADRERYQTVYARSAGSVAAPTAGLHFTQDLLEQVRALGVHVCFVTLHVGLGTFAPVKAENLAEHKMHEEHFDVPAETARAVNEAKASRRRVIAVGTTSLRVLESVARISKPAGPEDECSLSTCSQPADLEVGDTAGLETCATPRETGRIQPGPGRTNIFIYPPFKFNIVDVLLTNFHLPRSTLLMLVSAFAAPGEMRGRDLTLAAYQQAIAKRYRFFSYGDAMLIL